MSRGDEACGPAASLGLEMLGGKRAESWTLVFQVLTPVHGEMRKQYNVDCEHLQRLQAHRHCPCRLVGCSARSDCEILDRRQKPAACLESLKSGFEERLVKDSL